MCIIHGYFYDQLNGVQVQPTLILISHKYTLAGFNLKTHGSNLLPMCAFEENACPIIFKINKPVVQAHTGGTLSSSIASFVVKSHITIIDQTM
jgi:hypothetical protein